MSNKIELVQKRLELAKKNENEFLVAHFTKVLASLEGKEVVEETAKSVKEDIVEDVEKDEVEVAEPVKEDKPKTTKKKTSKKKTTKK